MKKAGIVGACLAISSRNWNGRRGCARRRLRRLWTRRSATGCGEPTWAPPKLMSSAGCIERRRPRLAFWRATTLCARKPRGNRPASVSAGGMSGNALIGTGVLPASSMNRTGGTDRMPIGRRFPVRRWGGVEIRRVRIAGHGSNRNAVLNHLSTLLGGGTSTGWLSSLSK